MAGSAAHSRTFETCCGRAFPIERADNVHQESQEGKTMSTFGEELSPTLLRRSARARIHARHEPGGTLEPRTGDLRMEKDHLVRILKRNPNIDRTAIDRSQQAAKQLAEVGVKVGGYRLEPALGGKLVRSSGQSPSRKGRQG